MARHRNIRGKNFDEDYEGYDDVYGHSVEDDFMYGASPATAEQFLYRRGHHELSSYLEDIGEDDRNSDSEQPLADSRNYERPKLSDVDEARLQSCLDEIRNVVGDTTPEHVLIDAVVANKFDYERALDAILNKQETNKKTRIDSRTGPQRTDNTAELDSRLRVTHTVDDAATQITRLTFEGKDPKQGFQVKVEDTSKGKSPEGGGVAGGGGGEGEMKVEGAGSRKGALSPTRLSESSSSRRSSRESLPNVCSEPDLQAYSSATSTPSRKEGRKASSIDIAKELEKRQSGKELLNLVVIGHVDAGKSTLMGHLLYLLGQVNQRVMHKYETESRKQGKASFAYAWVLDETEEERGRGITMDVGLTRFETTHRLVTLLDAPGHKDFIPNMITGAAQADAAILVVDATRGEFETGFESGGQTREHALLVRSLGVRQLVVGVNKLDTVTWSEERFSEIVKKLGSFLKQAGFKESDVVYIPCSGLTGENLSEKAKEPALTSWYTGPCLLDHIDKLKPPKRSIEQSMRLCVSDVFKGMGSGVSVSGKIETGSLQIGEKIMVMPAGENGLIKVITVHDEDTRWSCAGDHTTVVVTGVDMMNITIGSVICSHHDPIRATTRFQARVVIFNIEVPLTKGFPVLIHYQSVSEPAVIKKLVSVLHKSTGEVVQKKPKCLTKQMNAIIEIETSRPVCLELYKDYKELGRFMLRYGGSTIAAGVVTEFKN
ncbi:HBS1-like protein isoform X2 [Lytechinus pictus]|uniref:HBS1-like protein isoform X2 n=1 Tax=Lytechinus pictus TaxID=7653 RepID=UPI0030BA0055